MEEEFEFLDGHISHCCIKHGCKYNFDWKKCPVYSRKYKQSGDCSLDISMDGDFDPCFEESQTEFYFTKNSVVLCWANDNQVTIPLTKDQLEAIDKARTLSDNYEDNYDE